MWKTRVGSGGSRNPCVVGTHNMGAELCVRSQSRRGGSEHAPAVSPCPFTRRLLAVAALTAVGCAFAPAVASATLIYPTGGTTRGPRRRPCPPTRRSSSTSRTSANGPRRIGTEADARAAQYVSDQFRASGLTGVTTVDTPSYAWEALAIHSRSVAPRLTRFRRPTRRTPLARRPASARRLRWAECVNRRRRYWRRECDQEAGCARQDRGVRS